MRRLWSELKRRRVVPVVTAYVVVGSGIGGVVDLFLPNLGAPDWAVPTVLALIVLGLPIAVVMAWAYDLQPDSGGATAIPAGAGTAPERVTSAERPLASPPASPDRKSIAVLPFANMSGDPDNEYFSDGVTEDILTLLAGVEDLHVISRTSVMVYKNTSMPIGEIANALGVGTVLEGSVRRAGDRVRVTAQLIDASTDAHLWADTYDRSLDDIFAVQSDVAEQISRALHAHLAPDDLRRMRRQPATDLAAYELFVKGRQRIWAIRPDEVLLGIRMLEASVQRDPDLAPAHASLGWGYILSAYWAGGVPREVYDKALVSLDRALEIDPGDPSAWSGESAVRCHLHYDWEGAVEAARMGIRWGPSDRDAHFALAATFLLWGRYREAVDAYETAIALDPHDPLVVCHLAVCLGRLGRIEEAEALFTRIESEYPSFADSHALRATVLAREGRWLDMAEACRRGAELTGEHPIHLGREAFALARAGRQEDARSLADRVEREAEGALPPNIRMMLALARGRRKDAMKALDEAIEQRNPMVLWYRVGFLDDSDPEIRRHLAPVWPDLA